MSSAARRYYLRGRVLFEKGELGDAIDTLRSAIDLAPGFVAARVAYALALAQFGDCPRAAQTLRAGLGRPNTESGEATLWATLGDVLVHGGDFMGAEDAYQQAGNFSGFSARASAGMSRVHAKLGRYQEAFAALSVAAQANKILEG